MKKIKVAFVLSMLGSGGTEGFVLNVIKHLDKDKYDISVLLALDNDCKDLLMSRNHEAEQEGAKVYYMGCLNGKISSYINFCSNLKRFLIENGPYDVVHSHMDFFNGMVLAITKKTGISKRIAHAHTTGSQVGIGASPLKKMLIAFYRMCMRKLILNNATELCGCSEAAIIYEYGRRKLNSAQCIYNGVQIEVYKNAEKSPRYLIDKLSANNIYHILTVGRVANVKNPWFMVDIIEELAKIRKDFDFIWVGLNVYLDSFNKKIAEKNISEHFIFAGVRNDVHNIMKNSDVFILPSLFEGLGMVLVEAQVAGVYSLASNKVPALADCGVCEFLDIDAPDSAKKWALRISEILDNRPQCCVDDRVEKFNIEHTIEQLTKIYES